MNFSFSVPAAVTSNVQVSCPGPPATVAVASSGSHPVEFFSVTTVSPDGFIFHW